MVSENRHFPAVEVSCQLLCNTFKDISCPLYTSTCDDSYVICLDHGKSPREQVVEEFRTTLTKLVQPDVCFELCDEGSFLLINFE